MPSSILKPDDIDQIAAIGPFADLPREDVEVLIGAAQPRHFARHSLLFSQGDPADSFFVILEGRVKLFTATEDGDENVVNVFGEGRSFGEAAMFASGRFPVNAEVVEDARLVRIMADHLFSHLAENKDLAFRMLAVMARRHRQFQKDITDIKSKTPGQRLGGFILAQTLAQTDVLSGSVSTSLPFDKALIAARIGIKPESLSRALARLRDIGVDCQGRDVHIEDIQRLREFCEETEPHPSHR
ncbi:MAG: Crp/Fnr family transcriptional regulator [Alphaproteobacteria bacterium]|nr:Crp/Fnr family transcriptional regulator [Alphaproteobacteria bacterium]MBT4016809.1 Crp/Fnr family transcriptional regulator [Alphaproteobacteria bacterium]MBT5161001.1 Crp/Fnr family transcriptional regulator [Alphaproteobacteria bacterium]MBT5919076.1 Crp/Fnr family transcriptional regulator [Alphaproteobacteria bacterium]MBT6387665.1 Crp/Fnr family transcriptional regulator [Alphaproteobacteria bacterium]